MNYLCNYSNQADTFVTWGIGVLLVLKLLFELYRYVDKWGFFLLLGKFEREEMRVEFFSVKLPKAQYFQRFYN